MKSKMLLSVAVTCAALAGGHGSVHAATQPPVAPEVLAARERLVSLLSGDTQAVKAVEARTGSQMALRAQECLGLLTNDQACLRRHDAALLAYYGVRTLGVLLSAPPLRPDKPVEGVVALNQGPIESLADGVVARDANVAVLIGSRGNGIVVDLANADVISRIVPAPGGGPHHRLSPNGRVFAATEGSKGTTFHDTQTGKPLWTSVDVGTVLAWLPRLSSLVYVERISSRVMVADGLTGQVTPNPLVPQNSSYSGSLPGDKAAVLIGTAYRLQLIEHTRDAQGIQVNAIRSYRIAKSGPTSGQLVPMRAGKLIVYRASRDIGWLNLESGESGTWKTWPAFRNGFAKIDESRLLFDSTDPPRHKLVPWTFDIETQRVARVDIGRIDGLMIDTADRLGFMKRGDGMWFGSQVKSGVPQSLAERVGAFELARCQPEGEIDPPEGCANRPTTKATPLPLTVPDAASAAATAAGQLPCTRHEGHAKRLADCQKEQRQLAVRMLATSRLELVSRNVAEHLEVPRHRAGLIALVKDGRPASWCETVLDDIAARRNIEAIVDESVQAPSIARPSDGAGDPWRPPAIDEGFREMPHPKGSVVRGYVTVSWKGGKPMSIEVLSACSDAGGQARCGTLRIHQVTIHDSRLARACVTTFVTNEYVFEPNDRLVPLRAAR
jgi:hypothetical protein